MTSHSEFDVIVIGSGPGGYVAAIRAAQLGLRTACIEKGNTLGGTCLNVGCIPSKALLQSTEHYEWLLKNAAEHGVQVNQPSMNFEKLMSRKEEVVKTLVDGIAGLFKKNKVEWIKGEAQFISAQEIEVKGEKTQCLKAKNFILATGSEPIPLPFLPFDEKIIVSSTGALVLPKVPKTMIVIGAGVIGVELASVYRRLGTKIQIVEMLEQITPAMDPAISKLLLQILKKQGLEFFLGAKVVEGSVNKGLAKLKVEHEGKTIELSADVILVSVGRRPYSKGLNLSAAGIEIGPKGFIPVDGAFKTTQNHIYAIGDLIDGPMLAHRASEEGVAAAEIITGMHPHVNYMSIPNVIYTHPEVAAVGMTEKEAREAGFALKVGTCLFKSNARARCAGDTEGLVKVIGEDTSGRLLGLHIIGPNASEMIGEGVIALEKKMTVEQLANASHAHPTLSESIKEAALNALGRAIHF